MKKKVTNTWWFNLGWCLMELGLAWQAVDGNAGAERLLYFWSWVGLVASIGSLIWCSDEARSIDQRSEWVMHLMTASDSLLTAFVIWNGFEGMGWRFAIATLFGAALREKTIQYRKQQTKKDE